MRLANLLQEQYIIEDLKAETKETAIDELLGVLKEANPSINIDAVKDLIIEREEVENTSYGHGFAFPHARTDDVDDMQILLGVSKKGLKDRTRDHIPVSVVVLLLNSSNIARLYLQVLSAFANLARGEGNREKLMTARTKTDIIDIIWQTGVRVEKVLTVKDIMRRDVAAVTPDDSLKKVISLMFKNRLSATAVVDEQGNLLGQITDRDLIQAAIPDYESMIATVNFGTELEPFEELLKQENKIKVSQLYRTDHATVSLQTSIVEVAAVMIFKNLRRVFVVEDNKLRGILLRKDIVNMIIRG